MKPSPKTPSADSSPSRLCYRLSRLGWKWQTFRKNLSRKRAARKKDTGRTALDWSAAEHQLGRQAPFALSRGFIFYAVLLVVSLLFTQILRARSSHLFFLFVLLLLPALLLYTLTAKLFLHVYLFTDETTVEKMKPCTYEFRIINSSIFAYPFLDAVIRIPRTDAVRTSERRVKMSLAPFSTYSVRNEVSFRFRGTYDIGVTCFYVYDFFRLFRIRVDVSSYDEISVLPRKKLLEGSEAVAISDIAKMTTKSPYAYDRLEILDTREYQLGDSLKTVHWKLSSKSEDLIVRDYSSGASNRAIIYCDLSARFPAQPPEEPENNPQKKVSRRAVRRARKQAIAQAQIEADKRRREQEAARAADLSHWTAEGRRDADYATMQTEDPDIRAVSEEEIRRRTDDLARTAKDSRPQGKQQATSAEPATDVQRLANPLYYADMNEFCADGVVELTVSTVLRELRAGNGCTLMWFDARAKLGAFAFELQNEKDFDAVFRLFATAPLCAADKNVGKLRAMLGDTQGIKQVFVSSALDRAAVADLCNLPGMSGGANFGASELVFYNPTERFAYPAERRAYIESCRAMLAANGISAVDGTARLQADPTGKEDHAV